MNLLSSDLHPTKYASVQNTASDQMFSDALDILRLLQEEALVRFPAFLEAFGALNWTAAPDCADIFATDGLHLYFHPQRLTQTFLEHAEYLRRCYLHVHLHCLCFHMVQNENVAERKWDLACDLSAELMREQLSGQNHLVKLCYDILTSTHQKPESSSASSSSVSVLKTPNEPDHHNVLSAAALQLKQPGWMDAKSILELVDFCPELEQIAAECALDSHEKWFRSLCSSSNDALCSGDQETAGKTVHPHAPQKLSDAQIEYLETLQEKWEKKQPKLRAAVQGGQRSRSGGKITEDAKLERRHSMDYHKFLRRFAVPREEAILDMDSFDYIPYYYGLNCYANEIAAYKTTEISALTPQTEIFPKTSSKTDAAKIYSNGIPFIEPLEYSEVNRLDELAIAIDTSGSCSGKIVRRFLEETWSILRQRENFFSKMRLHLIQCDLMIQEHRIFTSIEEWEASLPALKIHGHGDTDFTPVFEHLEKLIQKREIRHLRGLLYFTDGDGIFPKTAPSFDTAFVFLNDRTEKHEIPSWGIRLNLHLPDEF